MQLPRFMRTRSGVPVEVLAQNVDNLYAHGSCSVVILATDPNGSARVGYRLADGSHPSSVDRDLDLIPYKADEAARHVQTVLDPALFTAAQIMWKSGKLDIATEIVATGQDQIDLIDFGYYLKQLWG